MRDTMAEPARGRTDREGVLREADAGFDRLNARAGGALGEPIRMPSVAAAARLAQRLGIPVSRPLVAADEDGERALWVRAEPEEDGVVVELIPAREAGRWAEAMAGRVQSGGSEAVWGDWKWETDRALRLTRMSPKAAALHGFALSELLGRPLTRLFDLMGGADGQFPLLAAVAARTAVDGQVARVRSDGRRVRLSAVAQTDRAGGFVGLHGSATLLDRAPEPVATADSSHLHPEALTQSFPDGFTQRLDRALRGPLSRIIATADSIQAQTEGPLRDDYAEYAGDIAGAGRHLLGLIEDLVDLQAVERDDFAVEIERIDLADVARRAAGLLSVRASEGKVSIDRPMTDTGIVAAGEFRRVLQILVNLVSNAVRHSPPGSTVWIRLQEEAGSACVIVADQGPGIAAEDHHRIFERFERLQPQHSGGSGLGLYLARRLARAMGGELSVDSAPGQGARFILRLPSA
ncbi:sensor histidine kinase [Stakelama saccharophila]|uniref:histidine kinase n=1 Tax=Stakelama saccharophila TaxID=3075605 RepID=A0ABZ0B5J0_9SPHN|nr:HAMP domain-containing sensor histidine kinase [Stakelama sp. W311]WNO52594.1 HAMP domain-containing sensor histidine kinase [Stakelama sp. W311]